MFDIHSHIDFLRKIVYYTGSGVEKRYLARLKFRAHKAGMLYGILVKFGETSFGGNTEPSFAKAEKV